VRASQRFSLSVGRVRLGCHLAEWGTGHRP